MSCRKIQELLKSDYLDGQANQREKQFIKEHLARCAPCRRLEEDLQAQQAIFKKAKRMPVPEGIWQNIRQGIVSEELKQNSGILQRLVDYLFAPRPVFVLASAFTIVIFVTVFITLVLQNRQIPGIFNGTGSDMAIYSLGGENDDSLYSLGTNIEEYFL
jgi:anti-sigma factor RsiW